MNLMNVVVFSLRLSDITSFVVLPTPHPTPTSLHPQVPPHEDFYQRIIKPSKWLFSF